MAKGRNTTVIGVRVSDSVNTRVKILADKQGLTVSEWVKDNIVRAAGMLSSGGIRSHHKKSSVNTKAGLDKL